MTQTLYVEKASGTFADALVAFGLARVMEEALRRCLGMAEPRVMLADGGSYYGVQLEAPLTEETCARFEGPYAPIPFIRTEKNAASCPGDLPLSAVVDYEHERDRRTAFLDSLRAQPREVRSAYWRGDSAALPDELRGATPHEDWSLVRAINPGALIGYNNLVAAWWESQSAMGDLLALLLDLYGDLPNDVEEARTTWKELAKQHGWQGNDRASALQLWNPSMGKGQNRDKSDKLSMGNVKTFWLTEYLKAVGFFEGAFTTSLSGSNDRKTYVVVPTSLSLQDHRIVKQRWQDTMRLGQLAAKSDIMALLRYTQALLWHVEVAQTDALTALLSGGHPTDLVAGLDSAYYKDLGNSAAVMGLPFLGLPRWIRTGSQAQLAEANEVLDEHLAIVRGLDESHSDGYALLLDYRSFCSSGSLDDFWGFTGGYAAYLVGRRERGMRTRQLSVVNLGRLIMAAEPRLRSILEAEGFQNIAYAIRQSTVTAQYRKQQNDRRYDVRYGLGRRLLAKAHYPDQFVAELSAFLHAYNAETAQVMETRRGPYRRSLRTSDIDDIVALVDEHGSELIGNLLVAYGYARTPREEQPTDEEQPEIEELEVTDQDQDE
ncbi:MAG: hypothetical protein ACOX2R_00370 [Anaerolineae bacterium]